MTYSREQLRNLVVDYAEGAGIDPQIALVQIKRESGFNPDAVGGLGERGLAQFTRGTWQRFGFGLSFDAAFDPDYNLAAWAEYMKYLLGLFDYDYERALIAYNGGEGHLLDPGRFGPPSAAARRYAREILAAAGTMPTMAMNTGSGNFGSVSALGMGTIVAGLAIVAAILVFAED